MGAKSIKSAVQILQICPLVWGSNCNLISHVYKFLITRSLVHHKNKDISLQTTLWEDIFHRTWWSNSYGKISPDKLVFRLTFRFSLISYKSGHKNNINTWQKRATFYPKSETNSTGFNTADLRLSPSYNMASWSSKRRMYGLLSLCYNDTHSADYPR